MSRSEATTSIDHAPARAEIILPSSRAGGVSKTIVFALIIAALGIGFALGSLLMGGGLSL